MDNVHIIMVPTKSNFYAACIRSYYPANTISSCKLLSTTCNIMLGNLVKLTNQQIVYSYILSQYSQSILNSALKGLDE